MEELEFKMSQIHQQVMFGNFSDACYLIRRFRKTNQAKNFFKAYLMYLKNIYQEESSVLKYFSYVVILFDDNEKIMEWNENEKTQNY